MQRVRLFNQTDLKMGSKAIFVILLFFECIFETTISVDISVPQGFPVTWNGDAYNDTDCEIITQLPSYLDGFLFCETTASYGDQNNPYGQKLIHMFDGISGIAKFDLNPVKSTFSGAYYPTESYKVWDLYSRDMTKSQVAWGTSYSPWNNSQKVQYDTKLKTMDYFNGQPSVDFWKIGTTMVTGTETYDLGLEFDVPTLTDFKRYPFTENNSYFPNGGDDPTYYYRPIHMAIHERTDLATGLLWNSVFTMKETKLNKKFDLHELVFTVNRDGNRTIVGDYLYDGFNESNCDFDTGVYAGDSSTLPGYMHSTTSTKNFFIMPLSSNVFNPCIFSQSRPSPYMSDVIWDPVSPQMTNWHPYKLDLNVKLRFLLYDKRDGSFRMINHNYPHFVTHQFNAYEVSETMLYIDMVVYDDYDYSGLYLDQLLNENSDTITSGSHLYRFTIDLTTNKTTNTSLVPPDQDNLPFEFPQFNHQYEGLPYKYSYILQNGYSKNSSIHKMDMDDPTGNSNLFWSAGFDFSLAEPYFVARAEKLSEDDGVVVVRGIDTAINKTRVFVLEATTLTKIAEIIAPDIVPFGFHNRYYSKADLNLPATKIPPSSADKVVRNVEAVIFSIVISVFVRISF